MSATLKRAKIHTRRTLADGRRMIQVVCPVCDHRHWMRDADTGHCILGWPGKFIIGGGKRRRRSGGGAWS